MTYGSWAPLIIFLENIENLGRGLEIDYNGEQRFQKYFQNKEVAMSSCRDKNNYIIKGLVLYQFKYYWVEATALYVLVKHYQLK